MSKLIPHSFTRRLSCLTTLLMAGSLLTGCGTITGLDASDDFSCPMTPGTHCRSLSDTYEDSVTGRTPDQLAKARAADARKATEYASPDNLPPAVTGIPTEPRAVDANPAQPGEQATETARPLPAQTRSAIRPATHAPARLPEVIVTIWIAPWTDDEGDFHEGERIHARAFDARWAAARRRADNASHRRAVVQLPFGSIGASRTSPAPVRPAPGVTDPLDNGTRTVTTPYGNGAKAFRDARASALKGTEYVRARFAEAGAENASVGNVDDRMVDAPVGGTDNLKVERTMGDAS